MEGGHQKCPLLSRGHLFHAKFREMNMIRHNGTYTRHHKKFGQCVVLFYYKVRNSLNNTMVLTIKFWEKYIRYSEVQCVKSTFFLCYLILLWYKFARNPSVYAYILSQYSTKSANFNQKNVTVVAQLHYDICM